MTTQRRMTQQSRRQLEAAQDVAVTYLAGSEGYTVEVDGALVCSSDGPMYYSTPALAMRAIRRIRHDLADAMVPVTWQSKPGPRPRLIHPDRDDAERIIEELLIAQETAQKLFEGLDADPTLRKTAHAAYARSLVGRLIMLESELLATPPVEPAT